MDLNACFRLTMSTIVVMSAAMVIARGEDKIMERGVGENTERPKDFADDHGDAVKSEVTVKFGCKTYTPKNGKPWPYSYTPYEITGCYEDKVIPHDPAELGKRKRLKLTDKAGNIYEYCVSCAKFSPPGVQYITASGSRSFCY